MSKVGTAHIEVKPVANEAAWQALGQMLEDRIAEAVARGIERGFAQANTGVTYTGHFDPDRGFVIDEGSTGGA